MIFRITSNSLNTEFYELVKTGFTGKSGDNARMKGNPCEILGDRNRSHCNSSCRERLQSCIYDPSLDKEKYMYTSWLSLFLFPWHIILQVYMNNIRTLISVMGCHFIPIGLLHENKGTLDTLTISGCRADLSDAEG